MPSSLLEAVPPQRKESLQTTFAYALLLMAVCQIGICVSGFNSSSITRSDFRAFYSAGYMVREGKGAELYDYGSEKQVQDKMVSPLWGLMPFFYPAYAALLFVPLSELSFRVAFFLFLTLNLMLAGLAAVILRPFLPAIAGLWKPLPVLLFLGSFPVGIAFRRGQVTAILLLLYCACYVAIRRGQDLRAGIFLALALIKFQIALPIALLFLAWRRWRFMAGFALTAAALGAASVFLAGGLKSYWQALTNASHTATTAQVRYAVNPREMPNLYGFFYSLAGHWGLTLTLFCSLLVVIWAAFRRPSLPLALLVGVLVSYHLFTYDLGLLLLPISLILNEMIRSTPRKIALCLCVLLLLPPLYMLAIAVGRMYLLACPVIALLFCFQKPSNSKKPVEVEPEIVTNEAETVVAKAARD